MKNIKNYLKDKGIKTKNWFGLLKPGGNTKVKEWNEKPISNEHYDGIFDDGGF